MALRPESRSRLWFLVSRESVHLNPVSWVVLTLCSTRVGDGLEVHVAQSVRSLVVPKNRGFHVIGFHIGSCNRPIDARNTFLPFVVFKFVFNSCVSSALSRRHETKQNAMPADTTDIIEIERSRLKSALYINTFAAGPLCQSVRVCAGPLNTGTLGKPSSKFCHLSSCDSGCVRLFRRVRRAGSFPFPNSHHILTCSYILQHLSSSTDVLRSCVGRPAEHAMRVCLSCDAFTSVHVLTHWKSTVSWFVLHTGDPGFLRFTRHTS